MSNNTCVGVYNLVKIVLLVDFSLLLFIKQFLFIFFTNKYLEHMIYMYYCMMIEIADPWLWCIRIMPNNTHAQAVVYNLTNNSIMSWFYTSVALYKTSSIHFLPQVLFIFSAKQYLGNDLHVQQLYDWNTNPDCGVLESCQTIHV